MCIFVLQNSRSTQRTMFTPANLTVPAVFTKLKEIATMTGNSVSNAKFPKVYFQYSLPLMKNWKKDGASQLG